MIKKKKMQNDDETKITATHQWSGSGNPGRGEMNLLAKLCFYCSLLRRIS